jgi:hypothetical protein
MEKTERLTADNSALIAGISILIMVLTVPIAEFGIFPHLFNEGTKQMVINLGANQTLLGVGILLNFITILCDVVSAWALYIFLSPVNQSLSLLVAWFRLLFAALYAIALYNLIQILTILRTTELAQSQSIISVSEQLVSYYNSFKSGWSFALILFGIYLVLLGVLVFKANYIPAIYGLLLVVAGIGYFVDSLTKVLAPNINTEFLTVAFFGELVFMGWLLIKGRKVITHPN